MLAVLITVDVGGGAMPLNYSPFRMNSPIGRSVGAAFNRSAIARFSSMSQP
jgi:hypothetical protein